MLTYGELTAFSRSLRDQQVLSIYVDGSATDPAVQRAWRVQVDHGLKDLRGWLADSSHEERERFERYVRTIETELAALSDGISAPGWVAFITEQGTVSHTLPVSTPTLTVWSTGPCLGPYVRALKQARPAIVAVADARKTQLYRYRLGKLDRVEAIRAHQALPRMSHMGTAPRQGFHVGTRGSAGHDAAQRTRLSGRDRMIAEAVQRIGELADGDGWIVLGGIHRVVARLAQQLEITAPHRVLEYESLDVHSTEADIAIAAKRGASILRDAYDTRRLGEIVEHAGARTLGVVGPAETRQALDQNCVRDLYVTHRFLEEHAADAEDAMRDALAQDASVEEVSRAIGHTLDELGGIAAGLRFRPPLIDTPVAVGMSGMSTF